MIRLQPLEIGDMVTIEGMTGRIVADITHGRYSPDYPEGEWGYLGKGFLWLCERQIGLVHYDDMAIIDSIERQTG